MNSEKFPMAMLLAFTACIALMVGFALGRMRYSGITVETVRSTPTTTAPWTAEPVESTTEAVFPLDLNSATAEELALLPGIGPVLSENIIVYRTDHGGFTDLAELLKVPGIGEKKFEAIRPYVIIATEEANENTGS